MTLLNAHESKRAEFRQRLFRGHGLDVERARVLTLRLVVRDLERDERRLCVECAHLMSGWRCAKREAVLPDVLQRCPDFEWEKP